jgi:post-segregation antitoxin (ccd killing protein)
MSAMSIRLSESLHANARIFAAQEGVSVNQLVATALAEKLAALAAEEYLSKRGGRASRARFDQALGKVSDVPASPAEDQRRR